MVSHHKDFGICKIIAIDKTIDASFYGDEIKSKFFSIKAAFKSTYGEGKRFDFLRYGSIWNEPKDWTMALLSKERTLSTARGINKDLDINNIEAIQFDVEPLSTRKAYITVAYQFKNFSKWPRKDAIRSQ